MKPAGPIGERLRAGLGRAAGILLVAALMVKPTSGFKNAVVWGAFLAVAIGCARRRRLPVAGGVGPALAGYLAVSLAATVFSIDPGFSMRAGFKLVEWMAGTLVLVNLLSTPRRIDRAVRCFFEGAALVAVADVSRAAWEWMTHGIVLIDGRWFDSLLGYPTIAAGAYAVALMVGLGLFLRPQQLVVRLVYGAGLLALAVLLYLLQTRSVLLGLSVGVIVLALVWPGSPYRRWGIVTALALALAGLLLVPGSFRARLVGGVSSDRAGLWRDAVEAFDRGVDEAPYRRWIGFGYGHKIFERLHGAVHRRERAAPRVYDHAHNMFIETRIQMGMLGVVAWVVLLGAAVVRGFRRLQDADPALRSNALTLFSAWLVLILYGQFSMFFAFLPALLFWSLLGAWLACTTASGAALARRRRGGETVIGEQ